MTKPKEPSGLEAHLGYWLRFVSNHVSHAFQRKVEALGATTAEWVVLRSLLDEDGASPSGLAESLGLSRGAVSKLVDRLVAKGLVEVRHDSEDRRRQSVRLTPAGRELVPRLAAEADRNDSEFFGGLSASEQAALAGLLQEVVRRQRLKGRPMD